MREGGLVDKFFRDVLLEDHDDIENDFSYEWKKEETKSTDHALNLENMQVNNKMIDIMKV